MPKLEKWQCSCARFAELECDWPVGDGFCGKPVCRTCVRTIEGRDYCPFHRGDPPEIAARKAAEEQAAAARAGEEEARKAAAIFGIEYRGFGARGK